MDNKMSVIDAHSHIIEHLNGIGYRGELRPLGSGRARWASGEVVQVIPECFGDRAFTFKCFLEEMNRCNVRKAILLQGSLYGFQNEYSKEAMSLYPNRFACLGSFDPYCLNAKTIMHRWIEDFGFKGLKFEMSTYGGFMGFHPDFEINGVQMTSVWEYCNGKKLVVSIDIGSFGTSSFQLEKVIDLAQKYHDVVIVIEHMFCPPANSLENVISGLKKIQPFLNIYVTLASLPGMSFPEKYPYPSALQYTRAGCDILGANRVMWGSDAPISLVEESYDNLVNYIPESGILNENELRLVFYENAKKVYCL